MTPANKKLVLQKGVTFIELTIVIAIFSIIAGSILFNFSRFGRTVTIQNLAQDIALQINSAQKDAISGRTNELIFSCDRTANDCAPTYGLYFVPINGDTAKIAGYSGDAGVNFLRFIDRPDTTGQFDGMLEAGGNACGDLSSNNTECLDLLSLGRGNTVSRVCVGGLFGSPASSTFACDTSVSAVNVAFKRPFPDAIIKTDDGSQYSIVRITISSPNADTKSKDIVVTSLGRITVEQTP